MKRLFVLAAAGLCLAYSVPAQAARSCNSIAASYYGPDFYGSIHWMLDMFGGKLTAIIKRDDCQIP